MRRFVVGTAGHVDHGKTTLVRALTGVDTDRLPEEKKRGITIELGFASWQPKPDVSISIIDVPGHRRLVHTMIAGATGMELLLLVVAADEGVMPQTREHLAACELLGIKRAVVALTKIDRTERELAELAAEEISELLKGRFEHEVVLCSAKTGEGLPALSAAVIKAVAALPAPDASLGARLSVDRVFSKKGAGTVVTGTLTRGSLAVGESIWLAKRRGRHETSVRGLHLHDSSASKVTAPTRLAINLASLAQTDVARGDVVSASPSVAATTRFDCELTLLAPIKPTAELEVYVGTAKSSGRLQLLGEVPVGAGDLAEQTTATRSLARLRLARPMVISGGDRVVLRLASSARRAGGAVVGGGQVLDAHPTSIRSRAKRCAVLQALGSADLAAIAQSLATERAPRALVFADLEDRFPVSTRQVVRALEKLADRGEVVRLGSEAVIDRGALSTLAERARKLVAAHHTSHPMDRGMALETLRRQLGERAGAAAAAEAIRFAAKKALPGDLLIVQGDIARMAGFVEGGAVATGGPLDQVRAALVEAGLKGLGEFALTELLAMPGKEARAVLAKLVRDGDIVAAGGQWFAKRPVEQLRQGVLVLLAKQAVLTIADFKDLSGLGRKQAIPLLELFDREGTTMRKGDDRVVGAKAKLLANADVK